MSRNPSYPPRKRGDGGWLALSLSVLMMVLCYPQVFGIARWIMETFFEDVSSDAGYLVIPIFLLCMMVGFFGLTVLFQLIPKLFLLGLFTRR